MNEPTYVQDAAEAARLLAAGEQGDWRVAQLTYKRTRNGAGRPKPGDSAATMEQWCAEVQKHASARLRFGPATGHRYARLWKRHGLQYGLDNLTPASNLPSFKDAYAEVDGTPDRERMMEYEGTRLLEKGTPEQKVEQAAALLRDPEVQQAATDLSSPLGGTLFGVAKAQQERTRRETDRRETDTRERFQHDPVDKALRSAAAITEISAALDDFASAVAKHLPEVAGLPDTDRDAMGARLFLRESYARAQGAMEQIGDLLRTGRVGSGADDFLKSVLGQKGGGAGA